MTSKCAGCATTHDDFNWKHTTVDGVEGWYCTKYFRPSRAREWTTDTIRDQRKEFFKSTLQPRRDGEPSREYIETYGDRGAKFTEKEKKTAKNVYKDLSGYSTWRKSK